MSWKMGESLVRAELDSRIKGRLTGRIWLLGVDEPITLDLEGNPSRDMAGYLVKIENPNPKESERSFDGLARNQVGRVGFMTLSHKEKVHETREERTATGLNTSAYLIKNAVSIQWFSKTNGLVLIASSDYRLELVDSPTWVMTEADAEEQEKVNAELVAYFVDEVLDVIKSAHELCNEADVGGAHEARLLIERIIERFKREGFGEGGFERVYLEEREKRKKELNACTIKAESGEKGIEEDRGYGPPLVTECIDLCVRLHKAMQGQNWLPKNATEEYVLEEIKSGIHFAGVQLAVVMHRYARDGKWPCDAIFVDEVMAQLQKAQERLADALTALDVADQDQLATEAWRTQAREGVLSVMNQVDQLIVAVENSLE